MTRRTLALLLFGTSAVLFAGLAQPARRERDAAREEYSAASAARERLRVRLADLDRGTFEEREATAADGATAARDLRQSALSATRGLAVSGVEVSTTIVARGAIAARGRLVATGDFLDALRLTRRLAASPSGLLLSSVNLAEAPGAAVRVEAEAFLLREGG